MRARFTRSPTLQAVVQAVFSTTGMFRVDTFAFMRALDELRRGDLQALRSLDPGLRGRFGIAHLRGRRLSLAAQCFIEVLLAHDTTVRQRQDAWLAR